MSNASSSTMCCTMGENFGWIAVDSDICRRDRYIVDDVDDAPGYRKGVVDDVDDERRYNEPTVYDDNDNEHGTDDNADDNVRANDGKWYR
mmetsp:Transcript_4238/g.5854  ORF Transcript_4238/g.5854 Transcript_4238/m.5854 type:complete len:90 (-) Transcript_4238:84-353(-)